MTFAHLKRTSYRSGSFRRAEKEKQRGCSLVPTSHMRSCGPAACPGAAALCRGAGGCSTLCSPCAHLHRSTLACSNPLCVILKYTVYRYGLCKSTFCKPLLKHRPFFLLHLPSNIYTMLFVREELKSVKERHPDRCFGSLYFRRRKGKGSPLTQEKEANHQSRRRPLFFFWGDIIWAEVLGSQGWGPKSCSSWTSQVGASSCVPPLTTTLPPTAGETKGSSHIITVLSNRAYLSMKKQSEKSSCIGSSELQASAELQSAAQTATVSRKAAHGAYKCYLCMQHLVHCHHLVIRFHIF